MLQKLLSVIMIVLAVNFIGMTVAGALLAQKSGLNRQKVAAIKDVLFPPEEIPDDASAPDVELPEPTPMEELLALLDAQSGKPTEERVEDMQQTFDQRAVALTRARRELSDLQRQLGIASARLLSERETFETTRSEWEQAVAEASQQALDESFARTLELYEQLPAKQTKEIFLGLEEDVVLQFLQSMDSTVATKVLKEFKSDAETQKARSILERMRQAAPVAEGLAQSAA